MGTIKFNCYDEWIAVGISWLEFSFFSINEPRLLIRIKEETLFWLWDLILNQYWQFNNLFQENS